MVRSVELGRLQAYSAECLRPALLAQVEFIGVPTIVNRRSVPEGGLQESEVGVVGSWRDQGSTAAVASSVDDFLLDPEHIT